MNGMELFLLGRTLMKIGEAAIPTEGIDTPRGSVRSTMVVLSDVIENPTTSVGAIARRTGLPQSAVSNAIARLRQAGSVTVEADANDGRRSVVSLSPKVAGRRAKVAATSIDDALARALGESSRTEVRRLVKALEDVARRFEPAALTRLKAQAATKGAGASP